MKAPTAHDIREAMKHGLWLRSQECTGEGRALADLSFWTDQLLSALCAQLTGGPDKVLRCAFCGEPYPDGTPTHKHESLAAHIRICQSHPVGIENRSLRAENEALRSALTITEAYWAECEKANRAGGKYTIHEAIRHEVKAALAKRTP